MGLGLPIIAAPCITTAFAHHPAFPKSITLLKEYGVRVLYDPERYPAPKIIPWETILDALNKAVQYTRCDERLVKALDSLMGAPQWLFKFTEDMSLSSLRKIQRI